LSAIGKWWARLAASDRLAIFLILLLAGALRVRGIGFLLPYFEYGPDERLFLEKALNMLKTGDLNPHLFIYGSFLFYFLAFIFLLYFGGQWLFFGGESRFPELIANFNYADHNYILLYLGRFSSLGFGLASIYLVYAIGKRLGGRRAGLLSALFLALSPFHIFISQILKVDSALAFFVLFSFYFSLKLYDSPDLGSYLWSGVGAGMALATKYNMISFLPIIAAHFLSPHRRGKGGITIFDLRLALSLYLGVMTLALTSPYIFLDFRGFTHGLDLLAVMAENNVFFQLDSQGWIPVRYLYQLFILFPFLLGIPLYPVFFAGVYYLGKNNFKLGIIFIVFPVFYFLLSGVSKLVQFQYQLPILPFAAMGAAVFLAEYIPAANPAKRKWGWLTLVLILLFDFSNLAVPHFSTLFSAYENCGQWVEGHLPAEKKVLSYYWVFSPTPRICGENCENIVFPRGSTTQRILSREPDYLVLAYSDIFNGQGFGDYAEVYYRLEKGSPGNRLKYEVIKEFKMPALWEKLAGILYREMRGFRITVFARQRAGEIPDAQP